MTTRSPISPWHATCSFVVPKQGDSTWQNPQRFTTHSLTSFETAYDSEKQLTKALPKLAKAATSPQLRKAFEDHLKETEGQIERLERVFESLDEPVRGKHCDGIAGIIEEGKSVMSEDFEGSTLDACLIAAGQRAEHYEMAAYGTLIAWAQMMGHSEAADLLQQNLDEEKAADKKLSSLAEGGINQERGRGGPLWTRTTSPRRLRWPPAPKVAHRSRSRNRRADRRCGRRWATSC